MLYQKARRMIYHGQDFASKLEIGRRVKDLISAPAFVGEFLCIVCVSVKSVEESPSATAWNGNETE